MFSNWSSPKLTPFCSPLTTVRYRPYAIQWGRAGINTVWHTNGNILTLTACKGQSLHHEIKDQGGVTPIDSIVTAATVGQSFDRLFSAV